MGSAGGTAARSRDTSALHDELPERDRRILDFERDWTGGAGAKEEAIRAELGLSTTRYYQVLNAAIDNPAAVVYDPMLVRRLQRMRRATMSTRVLRRPREGQNRETDG